MMRMAFSLCGPTQDNNVYNNVGSDVKPRRPSVHGTLVKTPVLFLCTIWVLRTLAPGCSIKQRSSRFNRLPLSADCGKFDVKSGASVAAKGRKVLLVKLGPQGHEVWR